MKQKINLINFINDINNGLTQYTQEMDFAEENKVSELHIHKILFIVYGAFYNKFDKELFEPNFQAWKYGPVEVDYRFFVKSGNESFLNKFIFSFKNKIEEQYLKNLITKLLKFSPWSLVDFTHSFNAWINNYDENNKNWKTIPKEDIFESFQNKAFD